MSKDNTTMEDIKIPLDLIDELYKQGKIRKANILICDIVKLNIDYKLFSTRATGKVFGVSSSTICEYRKEFKHFLKERL